MVKEYYVYVYLDPRKPDKHGLFDFIPFYVGMGHGNRLYHHLYLSHLNKYSNTKKTNKIKKLLSLGYDLKEYIVKYKTNLTHKQAIREEKRLIRTIGRKNLTNLTDGGEGTIGYVPTKETRAKISKSLMGNTYTLGYKHTEETKRKISIANSGRVFSKESNLKKSIAMTGKIHSSIHKTSRSRTHPARKYTTEQLYRVRDMLKLGVSYQKITIETGVSKSVIGRIKHKTAVYYDCPDLYS